MHRDSNRRFVGAHGGHQHNSLRQGGVGYSQRLEFQNLPFGL
jgi:hypothetical protein